MTGELPAVRQMPRFLVLLTVAALTFTGCAWLQRTDPPQVTLVGVEPAVGEGLQARMQLKLRVLNPNDTPIDYDGIYVQLDLLDRSFASGVSNQSGTVPAFGEVIIRVPVTVSVLGIAGQVMGLLTGKAAADRITYAMHGKLSRPTYGALRFKSQGEVNLANLVTGGR